MATYDKENGDISYRVISLKNNLEPPFKKFQADKINYDDTCILEVLQDNQELKRIYRPERKRVEITIRNGILMFDANVPPNRLWIRKAGSPTGTHYKIPENSIIENGKYRILLREAAGEFVLCGDQYFSMAYEIVNA